MNVKNTTVLLFVLLFILLSITPVTAQNNANSFFICEKTDSVSGEPIRPDSPQYDNLYYDNEIVSFGKSLVNSALLGMIIIGISGAVYASVRDAMFTPTSDDNPKKYVEMRIKFITAGVLIPIGIMVLGFILEWITVYEYTCLLPDIF